MLRLSRPTTGLLAAAALLSALSCWDGCADRQEDSPLDRLGGLAVTRRREDPEKLAAMQADVLERGRRLQEVTEEVEAGRLSLFDAAARVRDIESASPFFPWERFREAHPGTSDDERFCWMVIGMVSPPGLKERQAREPLIARLRAELEGHLRAGTLRLP